MPYITLGESSELQIVIPTIGSTDWGDRLRTDTFLKIAQHDHSGSGNGSQLGTGSLAADSVTGAKIRLDNDEYLRSRNFANSADINMIKIDTADKLVVNPEISGVVKLSNNIALQHRNAADSAYVSTITLNASDKIALGAEVTGLDILNNVALRHRNAADSAYIETIKVTAADKITLGADLTALAVNNNVYIQGRNQADSAYVDLIKVDASDKIAVGTDLANAAIVNNVALQHRNNADSAYIDTIKVNASDKIVLGAELTGADISNNVALRHRNNADSAYIDTIKINASDKIEVGANIVSASIETASTSLIDTLDSAVTLNDNQTATSAGIVTLGADESCAVHYRIVRNGTTQSGVLRFNDVDTVPSETFHGTDVGVTFTVSAGALQYATTSTGFSGSMTYVVIKE